ncbi:hypothetical protein BS47DRAFT_1369016 [Hydnum rufescens UP504]|uniref:Uncharacterized protein n=1 Tax=Hydnum rufescens UP504 TaxID=1448309 RepID=A0A9P6AEI5_9AGAM|nr:hypothetical protein BS47DRAFT_1369016 [Hydnum rufescens UP504]
MYASTDEAQGNIQERAATQTPTPSIHPLKVPPLNYPQDIRHAPHTRFGIDTSTSQYLTRQTNRQAQGKTQQHAQPPKPPSSICNIDADETNMVPHAHFSGYLHPVISHLTNEQTARAKHGSMRSHPRSPPLTIHNIHTDNQIWCHTPTSAGHHIPALAGTSTSRYHTRRMNRQAQGETRQHMQPPPTALTIRNICANEANAVPHTRFSGCVALLDRAQGETQEHAQPPKSPLDYHHLYADETNTVPHTHFSGLPAKDADLQFFLWEHAQWLIDLGKRWGCSIDALAPNVAQSEVGQSKVGQSEVGQSGVGQSGVGQSEVGQSEVGQSEVTQSEVAQCEVAQCEVAQSKVAQSKVSQYKVTQSKVAQSEVAQSNMPQSGISWADFPRRGGRTLTSETRALLDCRVPIPPQSKLAGSLAEQAAIPKLPRSDKWTVGPGEGEVDSSDDDEEFELEPQPVIADPVLLAATDLLHEGHSDDMGSETSSDEE